MLVDGVDFLTWAEQRYDIDEAGTMFVCKRCGQPVGYVTKHAAVRHGDDVTVLPVSDQKLAEMY